MNSRERFSRRGNSVQRPPDRPQVRTISFGKGHHEDGVDAMAVSGKEPLIPFRVVDGHPIGGGTSIEALRRAKRHDAKK